MVRPALPQKRSLTHNAPVSLCCVGCSTSVKQMQERACSSFRTRRVCTIPCTRKTRRHGPLPRMHAARLVQHAPPARAPSRAFFADYGWAHVPRRSLGNRYRHVLFYDDIKTEKPRRIVMVRWLESLNLMRSMHPPAGMRRSLPSLLFLWPCGH